MEHDVFQEHPRKLSIYPTVKASFLYVWQQRRSFAMPLIVLCLFQILALLLLPRLSVYGLGRANVCAFVPLWLLEVAFLVGLQRKLHRHAAGNDERMFVFDRTWRHSLLAVAKVFLCASVIPSAIAGIVILLSVMIFHPRYVIAITIVLLAASVIVSIVLLMKLVLALPAAALDRSNYLSLSWNAMRGNAWRVWFAMVLTYGPFLVVGSLLSWQRLASFFHPAALATTPLNATYWLSWIGGTTIETIGTITTNVMLCMTYGSLIGDVRSGKDVDDHPLGI
ncbi:hypothetical protein [Pararobbsia silviterrae]|uniref:Uncharacterized protein n=1 Tax=Pararobbsia silviterrae TaxID=1792498 RepID=A0A494XMB6_9BURK|nr:hypothetical protein [Pararobbsia silviterrae]RKP51845.1 hypothetical protein D7S86_18005 [Pararobbsia silviterrae]